jgi:hypothetical protein
MLPVLARQPQSGHRPGWLVGATLASNPSTVTSARSTVTSSPSNGTSSISTADDSPAETILHSCCDLGNHGDPVSADPKNPH